MKYVEYIVHMMNSNNPFYMGFSDWLWDMDLLTPTHDLVNGLTLTWTEPAPPVMKHPLTGSRPSSIPDTTL